MYTVHECVHPYSCVHYIGNVGLHLITFSLNLGLHDKHAIYHAIIMILYVLLLFCRYILYRFIRRNTSIHLPGPKPWPIVGNVLQIDPKKPYLTLDKWHHEYNKVFIKYRNVFKYKKCPSLKKLKAEYYEKYSPESP